MVPLSCVNCCHNPLQLGPIGTQFGYCTRHGLVLVSPQLTTCGQLLRKDLLAQSAGREQTLHRRSFVCDHVSLLSSPGARAESVHLVEAPNGQIPADPVVEEVREYGELESKIATMAALHRIPGVRAEVAMLSLSRAYFRTCTTRKGAWTSGIHLLNWTLGRLDAEQELVATDLRGPIVTLEETVRLARWLLLTLRLAFVADVGEQARRVADPVGRFSVLVAEAIVSTQPDDPDRLCTYLRRRRAAWRKIFPQARYEKIQRSLHRRRPAEG